MFPRSSRLISAGYYSEDAITPVISYKETTARVFRRRRRKADAHSLGRTTVQTNQAVRSHYWSEQPSVCQFASLSSSSSGICTKFSPAARKSVHYLLLLLLILTFGFWYLIPVLTFTLAGTGISHLVSPPTITAPSTNLTIGIDHMMTQMWRDLDLKEHYISEIVAGPMKDAKAVKETIQSSDLQQQLADLTRQTDQLRAESRSANDLLQQKMDAQEAFTTKMNEELLSIRQQNNMPPPVPGRLEKNSLGCHRPLADEMADFALEAQGASVVRSLSSETYRTKRLTFFGIPLWCPLETPSTVIQGHPNPVPGRCWCFAGGRGQLVISLSHPVAITHVTLDHITKTESPNGRIDSAPRDFSVYGMRFVDDAAGTWLGSFVYDQDGGSTQTFQLPDSAKGVFRLVKLVVETNWGHEDYTCLYRVRVHGKLTL